MNSRLVLISIAVATLNFACTTAGKVNGTDATKGQSSNINSAANKMACSFGQDIRFLELRDRERGCELSYTKHGKPAIVSSAHHGTGYCQGTMTRIRGNLENAGYTCK